MRVSSSSPTLVRSPNPTATSQSPKVRVSHTSRLVRRVPRLPSPKKPLVHCLNSSWSSTVKTDSRPKRVSTSTKCKPTTTTLAAHTQVCTRTPSRSSQKNTNQLVLATSLVLTMRKSRSLSQVGWRPRPCTCSRSTTMSSEFNQGWAVLALARNGVKNRTKKQALKAFVLLVCLCRRDNLVAGSSLEL